MGTGRALMTLGRVSNLPTVWSNCLVALAAGGGSPATFALTLSAASLFYLGGMYLNDAFDQEHDRLRRPARPIPSGAVSARTVWILGFLQLILGLLLWLPLLLPWGPYSLSRLSFALLLIAAILIYNLYHKRIRWSAWIMALCRFFLFLAAASVSDKGLSGQSLWNALSLLSYVAGLSYIARGGSREGLLVPWWPCILLLLPVPWAYFVSNGIHFAPGMATIAAYLAWTLVAMSDLYATRSPRPDRAVSRLLAGIVLVDLMSLGLGDMGMTALLVGCFLLALFLQRTIPAT